MKEIQCIQGSPEWFQLRRGIPTGSEFGRIVTPAKGEYAKGADTYAFELISESVGWYRSFKGSPDTERGHRLEKEALRWLRLHHGIKTRQVGFILSDCGRYGCSPDALTDRGEPVEVKCPNEPVLCKWFTEKTLPEEHKAQCHGEMILTGANCCHFVAYTDNAILPGVYIRVERDEFTSKLEAALDKFCDRLDQLRRELTGDEYDNLFPNAIGEARADNAAPTHDQTL